MELKLSIVNLYIKAATRLPEDIISALQKAAKRENGIAKKIIEDILENINSAKQDKKPICQDTGTPIFYVKHPLGFSQVKIKRIIEEATIEATKKIPLRLNAIDPLTNEHLSRNHPIIHFEEWDNDYLEVGLLLKGAGSENISEVYKLPNQKLKADRNIDGIKKCVIDAVFKAQGLGCPPYIIGVGISGLKQKSYEIALHQFLRRVDDRSDNKIIYNLERDLLKEVNKLAIGPMGLGGKTTAIAVKIGAFPRHPASFFVAINFMCWALRRSILKVR